MTSHPVCPQQSVDAYIRLNRGSASCLPAFCSECCPCYNRPLQCGLFCHKHDTLLPWKDNPWPDVVCHCNASISDQMLAFCHQPRSARPWHLLQSSLGSPSALPTTLSHFSLPILRPGTAKRLSWKWGLALLSDTAEVFCLWPHTPVNRATSPRGKPRTDNA